MDAACDALIRYLATERGLSDAYQLSVRQTLDALAAWLKRGGVPLRDVGTDELTDFLSQRKREGLNAASLRITTVHLKVFSAGWPLIIGWKWTLLNPSSPRAQTRLCRIPCSLRK